MAMESHDLEISLVDSKTTFSKDINSELQIHSSVSSIGIDDFDKNIVDLAIQSGIYSRFNADPKIGKEKFEELYTLWIKNSLDRKIASEVFAFKEAGKITGIVTLVEKNGIADIGIISVDHTHRGKGIGKILMQSAESWFGNQGYAAIQVVTQGQNLPACKLYEACGLQNSIR